jgi:hypothetical protein
MQEPYFFSYDELQQYNDDGRKSIECRKSYANVNVMGLIDDIMKGSENQPNDINSENQNSINYNNIVIEDGAIVESFILSNNIQDSFNQSYTDSTSEEIEKTLQELRAAVERMSKLLPQSEAEKAARDMDTLATEAKSTNPQNKWYQVSAEGLKKAAKNVGEVGGPVIELAGKIIGLLSPPKGG